jgi:hypothetical protein
MAQQKKNAALEHVLKLVNELSPNDLRELKRQLESKDLAFSAIDLQNQSERTAFFEQEEAKAGERVRLAFNSLQQQGILDEKGHLLERSWQP